MRVKEVKIKWGGYIFLYRVYEFIVSKFVWVVVGFFIRVILLFFFNNVYIY